MLADDSEPLGSAGFEGLLAFVDECGDSGLEIEKEGCSRLFIIVAIMVKPDACDEVANAIKVICEQQFSGAPLKSSRIGSDHRRRLRVLRALSGLPFSYCALVVDKARIKRDGGLKHRPSFYKYLNAQLYDRFLRAGGDLLVKADRVGGENFQRSFEAYMCKRQLPDLWSSCDCRMVNSIHEPLVQVADFVAGTLSFVFDPEKRCQNSEEYRKLLRPHEISLRGWPWKWDHATRLPEEPHDIWDDAIRQHSLNKVDSFLSSFEYSTDPDRQMQTAVLRHLLFVRLFEARTDAVYSDALIQCVKKLGFDELSKQTFRMRIVGPLRDAGILLAGSQNGYKLALCYKDVQVYVEHCSSIVGPMLDRLQKAREDLRLATTNQLDIVGTGKEEKLRKLLEALADYSAEVR